MLIDCSSEDCNRPDAVECFRHQVADGLGDGWEVRVVAYDDDIPDKHAFISAALVATSGCILVHISHHVGRDVVLVGFGESDPVPFEDLAVVKKALHRNKLLDCARSVDADDRSLLTPLVPFDRVLHLLRGWRCELHDDLNPENTDRATELRQLADEVAAGLFGDLDH